ncbi:MAG: hypothetical protein IT480_02430 [Gammaproteobacteria bacterium]|nr:hypothetical protein [Gammaproteobacteria bacterium]
MITRRRFVVAAGCAGAVAASLRLGPAHARRAAPNAAAAGAAVPAAAPAVLRIVQGPPGTPPAAPEDGSLLWRLGAHEWLDLRRLHARLARWPGVRIEALVDGSNHLLLVDALRSGGGRLLRERFEPATQRWSVLARAAAPGADTTGAVAGEHDDDGIS